jgi:hypothetical protein
MYQINDLYNPDLTRKTISTPTSVHVLHQKRDQTTGVERRKSVSKKKKRDMTARVNLNLRNKKIAELAQAFLKKSNPVKYGENAPTSSLA